MLKLAKLLLELHKKNRHIKELEAERIRLLEERIYLFHKLHGGFIVNYNTKWVQ